MITVLTLDPDRHLLVLGRMICKEESAENIGCLLDAIAGAPGSAAHTFMHDDRLIVMSDRGKGVIAGVSRTLPRANHK